MTEWNYTDRYAWNYYYDDGMADSYDPPEPPVLEEQETQDAFEIRNEESSIIRDGEYCMNHIIAHKEEVFGDKKTVFLKKLYERMFLYYYDKQYAVLANAFYKYEDALEKNGIRVRTHRCPGGKETVKLTKKAK